MGGVSIWQDISKKKGDKLVLPELHGGYSAQTEPVAFLVLLEPLSPILACMVDIMYFYI